MPNKNSSLTCRWMQEVWNEGREDAIDEMLDENAVVHGIEGITEAGPNGFKIFGGPSSRINKSFHSYIFKILYMTERIT